MRSPTVMLCLSTLASTPAMADVPMLTSARSMAPISDVAVGEHVQLTMPANLGVETLELERFNPVAPGARIISVDAQGTERPVDLSGLALFRGTISGDPDSLVFISITPDHVNGFVRSQGGLRVISSGNLGPDAPISAEYARDLNIVDGTSICSVDALDPSFYPDHQIPETEPTGISSDSRGIDGPCRAARIAVDTDYEFSQLFGGDTDAAAAYAVTLIAASSSVYERDVSVRFVIPYLRVFETNNDPYVEDNGTVPFLLEMRHHWNSANRHVPRETVHGLSGRSLGGGVAYVNALCFSEYAHGVSANLNGTFPMPVVDNSHSNWDLMVVSHELGHNFGTGHTHDQNSYDPVIDGCGNGDCSQALDTTIMSYCHLCPGGLSNMDMRLHPRVQERILTFLDNIGCDLTTTDQANPVNDTFSLYEGQIAPLDVLSNDAASSCSSMPISLLSHDQTTIQGGIVSLETSANGNTLVYTPAPGFSGTDGFNYETDAGSGSVTMFVEPIRDAWIGETAPGIDASYYELSSPTSMPDYNLLTPMLTEVVDQINFESTSDAFAGSGLIDNVGAVFEGFIDVPEDGWYHLAIESDDGSLLWIDNELLVNNDGLHGMIDRWNYIPLQAGRHALRAEFFEAGGGAGLIVRAAGATVPRQPIPATMLSRSAPGACPTDLAAPFGSLNFFDLVAYIDLWRSQSAQADIAPPMDTVDFIDFNVFLTEFLAGCP